MYPMPKCKRGKRTTPATPAASNPEIVMLDKLEAYLKSIYEAGIIFDDFQYADGHIEYLVKDNGAVTIASVTREMWTELIERFANDPAWRMSYDVFGGAETGDPQFTGRTHYFYPVEERMAAA